jgi:hypothetical protein
MKKLAPIARRWSEYGVDAITPENEEASDPFQMADVVSLPSNWLTIDPLSPFVQQWEAFVMSLLIFTAFATPYEVAFLETALDGLFVFNRLIDLCFLGDMFMCFILPYKNGVESYERRRGKIVEKYLYGWFSIDVVSIFPFDLLGILMDSSSTAEEGGGSGGGNASDLKVLRVVRCLRLIKLIRLAKASTTIQKFVRKYGIRNTTITLTKFCTACVVVSHWFSCLWMLVPKLEGGEENWATKYYGVPKAELPGNLYLACMYWSVMTLTTIGYGDVTASTNGEILLSILGMAVGASIYAYIVGAICGVLNNMDPISTVFNQKMDSLNTLMSENHMPAEIREDLREFLYRTKVVFKDRSYHDLFNVLSPGLQKTLVGFMHKDWINKVGLLKALPSGEKRAFVTQMAMAMQLKAYALGEFIIRKADLLDVLCIVKEGVIHKLIPYTSARAVKKEGAAKGTLQNKRTYAKKVLEAGSVFGSEIVARGAGFRCTYHIRAVTFVVVSELTRDELDRILEHPQLQESAKQLRMVGLKTVMQDSLIVYCRVFKAVFGVQSRYFKEKHEFVAQIIKKASDTGEFTAPSDEELMAYKRKKRAVAGGKLDPVGSLEFNSDVQPISLVSETRTIPEFALGGTSSAGTLSEEGLLLEARFNARMDLLEQRIMQRLDRMQRSHAVGV